MKKTTKEWFMAAEDDLLSAKTLIKEERLTNIVAFHCQPNGKPTAEEAETFISFTENLYDKLIRLIK
jgi:hypothetical protein